VIWP